MQPHAVRRHGLGVVALMILCLTITSCVTPQVDPLDRWFAWEAGKATHLEALSADEVLNLARETVSEGYWGRLTLPTPKGRDGVVSLAKDHGGYSELQARVDGRRITVRRVPDVHYPDPQTYVSGAYPLSGRLIPIPDGTWVKSQPGTDPLVELRRLSDTPLGESFQQLAADLLDPRGLAVTLGGSAIDGGTSQVVGIGDGPKGWQVHVATQGPPGPVLIVTNSGERLLEGAWTAEPGFAEPADDAVVALSDLMGSS